MIGIGAGHHGTGDFGKIQTDDADYNSNSGKQLQPPLSPALCKFCPVLDVLLPVESQNKPGLKDEKTG